MADIYLAIIACRLAGAGAMSRRAGAGAARAQVRRPSPAPATLRNFDSIFVIGFFPFYCSLVMFLGCFVEFVNGPHYVRRTIGSHLKFVYSSLLHVLYTD